MCSCNMVGAELYDNNVIGNMDSIFLKNGGSTGNVDLYAVFNMCGVK